MIAAIYSRKSKMTETGDSIENQIELCKKYALTHLNTNVEFLVYEDEGFSGGNSNRPQFKQLLKDAKDKKFNALICYRLDRISRNVADFSSTLELLQENNIDFISIKEQFDTSTPMGRAMVYISSVFAQLERETIAERIKDNMKFLAKSGRWLGGQTPLGFDTKKIQYYDEEFNSKHMTQLIVNEDEMKLVKFIYDKYWECRSLSGIQRYCLSNFIKGKNGAELSHIVIYRILTNPVYVKSNEEVLAYYKNKGAIVTGIPKGEGLLTYGKRTNGSTVRSLNGAIVAVSKHKGIIEADKWLNIQEIIKENTNKASNRSGTSRFALLSGLLVCAKCNSPMILKYSYNKKSPNKYYYYSCRLKAYGGLTRCDSKNINGEKLEKVIIDNIMSAQDKDIVSAFNKKYKTKSKVKKIDNRNELLTNIENKTRNMDNLLNKLANATGPAADFIMEKVNELSMEIDSLKTTLNSFEKSNEQFRQENLNLELALSNLSEFKKIFETANQMRKKELLVRIVDKIYIDYNNDIIDIKYKI